MKRSIPAFGVPLFLATALMQSDGHSPQAAPLILDAGQAYSLTLLPTPKTLTPPSPHRYGPGDSLPRAYTIFGLQTGPRGMAFTDENGKILIMAHPQIITGPFVSAHLLLPPPFTAPKRPQK
jgi:hypothetical protein